MRTVTDERGAVHALERRLGRGGQGEVWLVQGGRRVVKLLSRAGDREALRRRILAVKRLDLRELHVARPLEVLRAPDVGYVAEFLEDMAPIRTLMMPGKGAPVAPWYLETGGLRRRLQLLAHAGETLSALHGRGHIYGDVSHENVFVSAPLGALEAWLIDLDNLRHDSEPGRALYTTGYGAPEVVDGSRGTTSFSDAWGFAVLVFRTLTLVHPFHGDLVEEGEPEIEEEANAGRLPWVAHATDIRNQTERGIPRAAVLTRKLLDLARATFEVGVRDLAARARVSSWVEALHRAVDGTVSCDCGSTFYVTAPECPFCGRVRAPVDRAGIYRWEPPRPHPFRDQQIGGIVRMGSKNDGAMQRLPLGREPRSLLRRHTHADTSVRGRIVTADLEPVDRGVRVIPRGAPLWISQPLELDPAAARPIPERGITLPFAETPENSRVVHFGPVDQPHIVLTLSRGRR